MFLKAEVAGLTSGTAGTLQRGRSIHPPAEFMGQSIRREKAAFRFSLGFLEGGSLSGHGGLAGEDELGNVGESDGVAAGDALASELPDEIAEEEIHLVGSSETIDVRKKFIGEDFRIYNGDGSAETLSVVSTERWAGGSVRRTVIGVDQHVAAPAFGADVLALRIEGSAAGSAGCRRHGLAFLVWKLEKQRVPEITRRRAHPPYLFWKTLTPQGLGGGGRIKDCGERS
jgi:hypothetical protein